MKIMLAATPSPMILPAGMYIKRVQKSHRGSNKTYTYLHLVENVRTCAAHRSPNTG